MTAPLPQSPLLPNMSYSLTSNCWPKSFPTVLSMKGPPAKTSLCAMLLQILLIVLISHMLWIYCRAKKRKKNLLRSLRVVHFDLLRLETIKSVTENLRMYALLKTKSFIVTVSVRSLFFYSSVYDLKTIWMWEAMYCTVVMPYKNKMSSSSVSLDSLMEEREATERYDGRKISSLYLQNHLKTFLFFYCIFFFDSVTVRERRTAERGKCFSCRVSVTGG